MNSKDMENLDESKAWAQGQPALPLPQNRHARRKAAAERRHEGGFAAARPCEVHAVAIPHDGTPVALKVGV